MADDPTGPELDAKQIQEQLASFGVEEFLVSAASTIASIAYAKLEARDLAEARRAIDALAALVPLIEGELAADLGRALANLHLAYAEAASRPV